MWLSGNSTAWGVDVGKKEKEIGAAQKRFQRKANDRDQVDMLWWSRPQTLNGLRCEVGMNRMEIVGV